MAVQSMPVGTPAYTTGALYGAHRARPVDVGTAHALRKAREWRIAQEVTDREIARMARVDRYGR